jgi:baseplate J-like protein
VIFTCCDEDRLGAVRAKKTLNGIDFVEVVGDGGSPPKYSIEVHFVFGAGVSPAALDPTKWRIEGGERIRGLTVEKVESGGSAEVLALRLNAAGDFSRYRLRLIDGAGGEDPPAGFDPILATIELSFGPALGCDTGFDCKPRRECEPVAEREPLIPYLAKDYASFRQAMFDRMGTLLPAWRERNAADLGVTLVELLAYAGDYLSYRQDAIATEAYLGTARLRTSARRHARLVDYFMHDGCNARVWVQVRVRADLIGTGALPALPKGTQLFTSALEQPTLAPKGSEAYDAILDAAPETFETMEPAISLHAGQNEMEFYTWGAKECCLPAGATRATLRGDPAQIGLAVGDVILFQEVLGPWTGRPEDADPSHRHPVRLTRVEGKTDPLFEVPIIEIAWAAADALPFPLCISARGEGGPVGRVSVALGNLVLADHGRTIDDEPAQIVPAPRLRRVPAGAGPCDDRTPVPVPPRFRPALTRGPLTHAARVAKPDPATGEIVFHPFDADAPAAAATAWQMNDVLPAIELEAAGGNFEPRRDLLSSDPDAREFVVEIEADGIARLRFGDDQFGLRPNAGTQLRPVYRVGNGAPGNVGAGAIVHIAAAAPEITQVTNPLPARGGVEPETIEEVRAKAPYAFSVQERAVTPADYAEMARRVDPTIQRAAAFFRWTGSWRTVVLCVDRFGGAEVDPVFEEALLEKLERYRMAGHDLEIAPTRYVPLEVEMGVCVRPGYFRSDVEAALLEVFSSRRLANGRLGLFHPDNFTFGQTVYLSPLYAAAQATPGVASVSVVKFQRLRAPGELALTEGRLTLDPLEIVRLDNDPNFPERGIFRLHLEGGK